MAKTQQLELLLQADIIGSRGKVGATKAKDKPHGLLSQGFWADKTSERFKAGKPDLRISRADVGQLDVELKYCDADILHDKGEIDLGFTKLQWLKLREMNQHGIPAIGLVYMARQNFFLITNDRVLCYGWTNPPYTVMKLPAPQIIDGAELVTNARKYLYDFGYRYP